MKHVLPILPRPMMPGTPGEREERVSEVYGEEEEDDDDDDDDEYR